MPSSVLNSDDGVISGTSGIKAVGGDDGVLVFQSKGTETAQINTDKQIVAAAGTASLPVLTTTGDVNTGIYFPAADNIGFATGGTIRGRWTTDGLCFGSDTAAANALDDYEEGTWTVEIYDADTGGNVSSTTSTGHYTKIGRSVSILFDGTNISTTGLTAGNTIYFTLPFTPSASTPARTAGSALTRSIAYAANTTSPTFRVYASASRGTLEFSGSGLAVNSIAAIVSNFNNGVSDFAFSITYNAA